jgi:hypothetical protein
LVLGLGVPTGVPTEAGARGESTLLRGGASTWSMMSKSAAVVIGELDRDEMS